MDSFILLSNIDSYYSLCLTRPSAGHVTIL